MIIGTEEEQLQLEKEQQGKYLDKYLRDLNKAIDTGRFDETREGMLLIKLGFEPFRDKIREYLGTSTRGQAEQDKNYLRLLSSNEDEIAFIAIRSIVSTLGTNRVSSVASVARRIIINMKKLHLFSRLKRDNPKLHSYLGSEYRRASAKRKEELVEKHIVSLYKDDDRTTTASSEQVRVGATLIDILIKSGAGLIDINTKYLMNRKKQYIVSLTAEAYQILLTTSSREKVILNANMLPMVVEPKPWTSMSKGGFLQHKLSFVKARESYVKDFYRDKDLSGVMEVVNKLQKTPWRVNTKVLDVLHDVFYGNLIDPMSSPTLPRGYGDIPLSRKAMAEELIEPPPIEYSKQLTKEEKKVWGVWSKKRESVRIDLDAEASRRLKLLMSFDVANKMKQYENIWYVYNVDYRGRVYTNNEFLNPQSTDYIKAMLELGNGEHLTDEGLYWLKIHIANTYGKDKEELDDRVKWFDSNVANIIHVTENWRESLSIWTKADSPYEFLAGCYAYLDYLQGNKVHLPIQLDATCSGIQMYSGLLKDREGGRLVNIIGDKREDIYQEVANETNKRIEAREFSKYVSFSDSNGKDKTVTTKVEMDSLAGNITRSMVKRNVMTIPYSVSRRGMSSQNWDMMHDMKLKGKNFWKGDEWVINKIWSEVVFESSYSILRSSKLGQEFIKDVVRTLKEPAHWVTPIYKFPICQPALKHTSHRVQTPIGTLLIKVGGTSLNRQKQINSIAPNYIHSIDSTILLHCVEHMSTDIGVIHDCFLVHPNYGEEIRHHYREGFIKTMESEPLKQFSEQIDKEGVIEVPCIGTLNLDEVRDSKYIIS